WSMCPAVPTITDFIRKDSIVGRTRLMWRVSVTGRLRLSRRDFARAYKHVFQRPLRSLPEFDDFENNHCREGDRDPNTHGLDWQPGPRPNQQAHHLLLLVTPTSRKERPGSPPKTGSRAE